MTLQTTVEQFRENPDNERIYQQERLLVDATELVSAVMETTTTKRGELAERLGRSKAYVTQILRGSQNLTLRTLADVFWALDHRLVLRAEPISKSGIIDMSQWNVSQQTGNSVVAAEDTRTEPNTRKIWGAAA